MMIGGIDPGKSGGLVAIDGWHILKPMKLHIARVPIVPKTKKVKAHPDWDMMYEYWSRIIGLCDHIFIERVGGGGIQGRQQGGVGMFNFGYVAGFPFGIVKTLRIPYTFVTPQQWKKRVGLKGSDKKASRLLAAYHFTDYAKEFKRVKDDGVAEAALIAYSGGTLLSKDRPDKVVEDWERGY